MIQYRSKERYVDMSRGWDQLKAKVELSPRDFISFDFAINGRIFTKWDDEFEKALAWEKLQRK